MRRVAVLVSGSGTNLQALIDAKFKGEIPSAKLVLVLSSRPGVQALERARIAGIPSVVVDKSACQSPQDFDQNLLSALLAHRVEVLVLAGFLPIVGPLVLHKYNGRIINVHPSLIPFFSGIGYYGLGVHQAALDRGVKVTGATVHLVTQEVDGGEILLQKSVSVEENDTPELLQQRVMQQAEWILLPQGLEIICRRLEPIEKQAGRQE